MENPLKLCLPRFRREDRGPVGSSKDLLYNAELILKLSFLFDA